MKLAFGKLTPSDKLYAHYMSQACWLGSEIVLHQTSVESPDVWRLLLAVFSPIQGLAGSGEVADLKAAYLSASANHTAQEWEWFTQWAATFFTNTGNYLSFGDTKFIPRVAKSAFAKCCHAAIDAANAKLKSAAAGGGVDSKTVSAKIAERQKLITDLLASRLDAIYSLKPIERSLSCTSVCRCVDR